MDRSSKQKINKETQVINYTLDEMDLIDICRTFHPNAEEYIIIINIYEPNIGAPQYLRQTLTDTKGEIDSNTIIVGDFNTPLTPMDTSSKQKINKEAQVLNDTLDRMDLIDIFKTFHPNAEE